MSISEQIQQIEAEISSLRVQDQELWAEVNVAQKALRAAQSKWVPVIERKNELDVRLSILREMDKTTEVPIKIAEVA